jgi:hypothetical protein
VESVQRHGRRPNRKSGSDSGSAEQTLISATLKGQQHVKRAVEVAAGQARKNEPEMSFSNFADAELSP